MSTIRIVRGAGDGPTEIASYDAALADAGVHNYNLVSVSSVIPAGVRVEAVGAAPDLGPAGERLTVVEGRATAAAGEADTVSACLGWVRDESEAEGPGPGLFYEAAGACSPDAASRRVLDGLAAGRELRDWEFGEPSYRVQSADVAAEGYTTVVVLAVYGESDPLV